MRRLAVATIVLLTVLVGWLAVRWAGGEEINEPEVAEMAEVVEAAEEETSGSSSAAPVTGTFDLEVFAWRISATVAQNLQVLVTCPDLPVEHGIGLLEAGPIAVSFPGHSFTETERELAAAVEAAMTQEVIGAKPREPHRPWRRIRSGLVFRVPEAWAEHRMRYDFEDWEIVSRPSD